MILYSRSEVITPHSTIDAWYSVNMKPDYIYPYSHYEEGLAFIWSYLIYEMMRVKRETYFIAII